MQKQHKIQLFHTQGCSPLSVHYATLAYIVATTATVTLKFHSSLSKYIPKYNLLVTANVNFSEIWASQLEKCSINLIQSWSELDEFRPFHANHIQHSTRHSAHRVIAFDSSHDHLRAQYSEIH